jgi:hypothetical protein
VKAFCLLLTALLGLAMPLHAAEKYIEINMDGTSTADQEGAARAQIMREVTEKAAEKYILDFIGEKKFESNQAMIQKVVKEANKFILFIKAGELSKTPEGFKMSVNLKLSPTDLRELLTKEGLLYESDSAVVALPVIAFADQVRGGHFVWWAVDANSGNSALLSSLEKKLEVALRNEFAKKGFFVLKPAFSGFVETLPQSLRVETLRPEELESFGEFFKAQMILSGQVSFENSPRLAGGSKATIKITALQAQTGRFVAEVARSIEIDPGSIQLNANKRLVPAFDDISRDLSAQVLEAWKRGTFGAELLKISVNGKFEPTRIEAFKTLLLQNASQLHSLRERLFEPGRIVFEADISGTTSDLANRLKSVQFEGAPLQVSDVGADHLTINLKSR